MWFTGSSLTAVVFILGVLAESSTGDSIQYYITATTPCPAQPCFTLSGYVTYRSQNQSAMNLQNTTLILLAGIHTLVDRGIVVTNVASFTMIGDSTGLPALRSVITCFSRSGPIVGLDFTNTANVTLSYNYTWSLPVADTTQVSVSLH